MALSTGLPDGLRLAGFEREAEAREVFRGYDGKEHAVAPDASIQVAEADGRILLGLVEQDLGTMSARQLKAKAEGYGEYAKLEGWRRRNKYCPPLLFITTSEKRARQLEEIGELARRFGEGPALRKARDRLRTGELLAVADVSWLRQEATDDERSRSEQERLRSDYLAFREEQERRHWKSQRLVSRLRNGPGDRHSGADREQSPASPAPFRACLGRAPSSRA